MSNNGQEYVKTPKERIYVLINQEGTFNRNVCVSDDIQKIRKSLCNDFDQETDFPVLEIWNDGKLQSKVEGNPVLKAIADEINNMEV